MIKTLMTLLVVAVVVCAVYLTLRALIQQLPEANAGLLGVMVGMLAGGILRRQ